MLANVLYAKGGVQVKIKLHKNSQKIPGDLNRVRVSRFFQSIQMIFWLGK